MWREDRKRVCRRKLTAGCVGLFLRLYAVTALAVLLTTAIPLLAPYSLPAGLIAAMLALVVLPTIVLIPLTFLLL